jgi:hypothetical protein
MKSIQMHENGTASESLRALAHLCFRSCQKVLAQIRGTKGAILAEWRGPLQDHEHMLKLALNEAEALAWQTAYPHLVFPALAVEKIQGALEWVRHQRRVLRMEPGAGLAA